MRRYGPVFFLFFATLALLAIALPWNRSRTSAVSVQATADSTEKLLTSSVLAERMPAISDDGKRYAFVQFDEKLERASIVLGSMDSDEKRIVSVPEDERNYAPQWSRDGSRLAFQSSTGSRCGISVLEMNGMDVTSRRFLGTCPGDVYDMFDWAVGDRGLWLSRPVGPDVRATQIVLRDLQGVDHPLDYQRRTEDFDRDPRQSPDGRWIAFRRGVQPRGALFLVASGGGEVRQLTEANGYLGRFDWYPDSRHLLMSSRAKGRLGLYRLDTATRQMSDLGIHDADAIDIAQGSNKAIFEHVRLRNRIREYSLNGPTASQKWRVPSTGSESEAVYDPMGTRIAFISDRSGTAQIWLTPAEQDQPRQLTRFEDARLFDLSFSSDGNELVWVLRDDVGGDKVCLLDTTVQSPAESCMAMAHKEIRTPRRLASPHRLLYAAQTPNGWAAFVTDLGLPPQPPQRVGNRSGIDPNLQVDGDAVYLTDPAGDQILLAEPPYRDSHQVLGALPAWQASRWQFAGGAAWYVWSDLKAGNFKLYRARLAAASAPEDILDLGPDRAYPMLDIASDARRILVRTEFADETDIGVFGLSD